MSYYPDDPLAPDAQFYIGQIHLGQLKYDQAVMDFDAVLERFPENKMTPGRVLHEGHGAQAERSPGSAAATEFRNLIKKYPRSDRAIQATEQLRALGLSAGTTPTAAARQHKK